MPPQHDPAMGVTRADIMELPARVADTVLVPLPTDPHVNPS
jgi:hypothetical protein